MKSSLKGKLEEVIEKFLNQTAEAVELPEGYCPTGLAEHMANAAAAVFDCSYESSKFTENELKP